MLAWILMASIRLEAVPSNDRLLDNQLSVEFAVAIEPLDDLDDVAGRHVDGVEGLDQGLQLRGAGIDGIDGDEGWTPAPAPPPAVSMTMFLCVIGHGADLNVAADDDAAGPLD